MAVRLVVTITAAPGKGGELAQAFRARCAECMQEPGCEQFEVFQSVLNPDKLALLELWKDQAALDAHAKVNATRAPMPAGLRVGGGEREDYEVQPRPVGWIRKLPQGYKSCPPRPISLAADAERVHFVQFVDSPYGPTPAEPAVSAYCYPNYKELTVTGELSARSNLPAISLWQPWASLTAHGRMFETRSKKPAKVGIIGKRVAIHATKKRMGRDLHDRPISEEFRRAVAAFLGDPNWEWNLRLGAVVATAVLVGAFECGDRHMGSEGEQTVLVTDRMAGSDPSVAAIQTDPFGDFSRGRWAWRFEDARPIYPPIPARGYQYIWHWTLPPGL